MVFGLPIWVKQNNMNTIILFLAILLCCWLIFKSIDYFEKI